MSKHKHDGNEDRHEIKVEFKDKDDETVAAETAETKSEKAPKAGQEIYEETIAGLDEKLKEAEDKYLRLAAEFDNFRKRTARQFEDMSQAGRVHVIAQLLTVLDNFQRALDASANSSSHDSLREGTELVYKNLYDVLTKEGLEPIEAVGKPFDPNLHDALMQLESDEHPEGIVVQEIVKGYKLNDRVLRHSKVAVSKGPGGKSDASENDD